MYQLKLKIDEDIVEATVEAARQSPGIMKTLVKRRFSKSKRKILAALRKEPGPPTYPLRWKSEKQRRYVMMILTEENNLPYQRTHNLVNAWEVNLTIDDNGGQIDASNDDPAVQFVQGDWTQPFHLDTGWGQAAPILVDAQEQLNDDMINDWYLATNPEGAVSG